MLENCSRALGSLLGAMLVLQSVGCGTILHPERKGQQAGKIDVAVAALDAIGLLFFIVPGVIAFAVDFNNGTIYLPAGGKGLLNRSDLEKVRFDPRANAKANVEKALRERTDLVIQLDQDDLEVIELMSLDELPARFASASRVGNSIRIAMMTSDSFKKPGGVMAPPAAKDEPSVR